MSRAKLLVAAGALLQEIAGETLRPLHPKPLKTWVAVIFLPGAMSGLVRLNVPAGAAPSAVSLPARGCAAVRVIAASHELAIHAIRHIVALLVRVGSEEREVCSARRQARKRRGTQSQVSSDYLGLRRSGIVARRTLFADPV